MTAAEITALRRAYGEICRGYSEATYRGEPVYVAHLTSFDQTEIDILHEEATANAAKRGISTEADKLKWLERKGIWTPKDDRDLNTQRMYVDNLRTTRSKLFVGAQIETMSKQVNEEEAKLNKLADRRARAVGLTAEEVGSRRVQLEYVRLSFYCDRGLEEPMFTPKDVKELDDDDVDDLLITYQVVNHQFRGHSIRKMAVQPFFINQFYLCERLYDFFAIPIVDLTIHQTNLLDCGQYFRNILTHHQVPKEFLQDPDKIEEFVTRSTNAKKAVNKVGLDGGRTGIVGGSAEDLKMMGVEDGTKTMQDVAAKGYKDARSAAKDVGYTVVNK